MEVSAGGSKEKCPKKCIQFQQQHLPSVGREPCNSASLKLQQLPVNLIWVLMLKSSGSRESPCRSVAAPGASLCSADPCSAGMCLGPCLEGEVWLQPVLGTTRWQQQFGHQNARLTQCLTQNWSSVCLGCGLFAGQVAFIES